MKPRIIAWTAGWWRDAAHAQRFEGTWQGYRSWYDRVQRCFKPVGCFIASGSWSNPAFSPVPEAVTVNAGVDWTKPFIYNRTNYSCMAVTAAMAFALNVVTDWDYLILVETDCLIGAIDIPALLAEFAERPQLVLSPSWAGAIGGPMVIWKPEGALRMLHHRPYVSFVDDDEPNIEELPETQWQRIMRGGTYWWNPWPNQHTVRQEYCEGEGCSNVDVMNWPVVARPHPDVVQPYIAQHLAKAVTL